MLLVSLVLLLPPLCGANVFLVGGNAAASQSDVPLRPLQPVVASVDVAAPHACNQPTPSSFINRSSIIGSAREYSKLRPGVTPQRDGPGRVGADPPGKDDSS